MAESNRLRWTYPSENMDPWYDAFAAFVNAVDASVYTTREDRSSLLMSVATVSFTISGIDGTLAWNAPIELLSPIAGFVLSVSPGSVTLRDGDVLYMQVVRGPTSNVVVSFAVARAVPNTDDCVLMAIRRGATVYWRDGKVLNDGESLVLFATNGGGGGGGGGLPVGTDGGVLAYSGTWGSTAAGTPGQVLRSTGAGVPVWGTLTAASVGAVAAPSPLAYGALYYSVADTAWKFAEPSIARVPLRGNADGATLAFDADVAPLTQRAIDGLGTAVTVCATLTHDLNAGGSGDGIGARTLVRNRNSVGALVDTAAIDGVFTTVAEGSEAGVLDLRVRSGGTLGRVARFKPNGIRLDWAARSLTVLDGGGTTEVDIFRVDGSNYWVYGTTDATNSGGPILLAPAAGEIILRRGATDHLAVQGSGSMLVGHLSYPTTLRGSRLVFSAPVTVHDTANNSASIAAVFAHTLSSGTPSAGIGVRTTYDTYNNGFTTVTAAATDAVLTQVSSGFEQGAFDMYAMASGALTRIVRIASSGLRLDWTRALTILNSIGSTALDIFRVVGGTNWTFGSSDGTNVNSTVLLAPSGGSIYLRKNSTDHLMIDSAGALWLGTLSFPTTISGSRIVLSGPITVRDTSTNAASVAATFAHTLSSGTAAAGIAARTAYAAQNASGTQVDVAYVDGILTTATAGSEVGALAFYSRTGGSLAERMRIHGAGGVTVGTNLSLSSGLGIANAAYLYAANSTNTSWFGIASVNSGGVLFLGDTNNTGIIAVVGATASYSISAAGGSRCTWFGYLTAASGTQIAQDLTPAIQQTGTAGWTGLRVAPSFSSEGSGVKRAFTYVYSGTERFGINELGRIINGNSANEATSATAGANGDVPGQVVGYLLFQDSTGVTRKIPYYAN